MAKKPSDLTEEETRKLDAHRIRQAAASRPNLSQQQQMMLTTLGDGQLPSIKSSMEAEIDANVHVDELKLMKKALEDKASPTFSENTTKMSRALEEVRDMVTQLLKQNSSIEDVVTQLLQQNSDINDAIAENNTLLKSHLQTQDTGALTSRTV